MNKKIFTFTVFFMLLALSTTSRAENTIVDINDGTYPDFSKWYYFSFETGQVVGSSDFTLENVTGGGVGTEVPSTEWAERSDWDIAFHATDIRTNRAKAIMIADNSSTNPLADIYANLTEAPADGYTADEVVSGTFIQSLANMPPPRATQMSVCKATHGWATYGMGGSGTNPMVVVFELANGKYIKAYLKDFFNESEVPGFIEMEYAEILAPGASGLNNTTDIILSIYPNPASDILYVKLAGTNNNTKIIIYNTSGIMVKQVQIKDTINQIGISDLTAGTYFVKSGNSMQKIIVQ